MVALDSAETCWRSTARLDTGNGNGQEKRREETAWDKSLKVAGRVLDPVSIDYLKKPLKRTVTITPYF